MGVNGNKPGPARTGAEREMERMQREVTRAQRSDTERRRLIAELYTGGMTQVEIAARLTRASRAAGGHDVGVDAVQKLLKRDRMKGTRT